MRGDRGPRQDRHGGGDRNHNALTRARPSGSNFDDLIEAHSTGVSRDFQNNPSRRVRHPEEERKGVRARRNLDESMMQLDDHGQVASANWTPDLDDANINVELEQGRSSQAGKL